MRAIQKEITMLILTRKPAEEIYIGPDIIITVIEVKGKQVRLGIEAPREIQIHRSGIKNKEAL